VCPECEAQNDGEDQRCSIVGAATTDTGSNRAKVVVSVEVLIFLIRSEPVKTRVDANAAPDILRYDPVSARIC
jgi:hypothetical protein